MTRCTIALLAVTTLLLAACVDEPTGATAPRYVTPSAKPERENVPAALSIRVTDLGVLPALQWDAVKPLKVCNGGCVRCGCRR